MYRGRGVRGGGGGVTGGTLLTKNTSRRERKRAFQRRTTPSVVTTHLQIFARRRFPARANIPEQAIGLVEATALQRESQPGEGLEPEEVVQYVSRAAVVGTIVERRRVGVAPRLLGGFDDRLSSMSPFFYFMRFFVFYWEREREKERGVEGVSKLTFQHFKG